MLVDLSGSHCPPTQSSDQDADLLVSSARLLQRFNSLDSQGSFKASATSHSSLCNNPQVEFIKKVAYSILRLGCMYGVILLGSQMAQEIQTIPNLEALEGSVVALTSAATLTVGRLLSGNDHPLRTVELLSAFSGVLASTPQYASSLWLTIGKILTMTLTNSIVTYGAFKKIDYQRAYHLTNLMNFSALMVGAAAFSSLTSVNLKDDSRFMISVLGLTGFIFTGFCLKAIHRVMRDTLKLSMPNF